MRFTLCTAVDGNSRLHAELVLWTICASRLLPRDQYGLVAYLIDCNNPELERWLVARGVEVRRRDAPVPGVSHCNRLAAFMDSHDCDYVIATDSDLFFVRDPGDLFRRADQLRAAPNNACNPPAEIFRRLLAECGLGRPYRPTFTPMIGSAGKQETHINNVSAGIIALPADRAEPFARLWAKWARWLFERRHLLDQWAGHIDQAAFALACEEAGEDVVFLPPQANLVLHLLDKVETVYGLHLSSAHVPAFKQRFRPDRTMNADGLAPDVAESVGRLNDCILEAFHELSQMPPLEDSCRSLLNPQWIRP